MCVFYVSKQYEYNNTVIPVWLYYSMSRSWWKSNVYSLYTDHFLKNYAGPPTPLFVIYTVKLVHAQLFEVMNLLWKARINWYNLGLALGIDETTLKTIQVDYGDVESCFREMLSKWLKMISPPPSYEALVKVLVQPPVDCKELASELAKKHNIPLATPCKKLWLQQYECSQHK